MNGFRLLGDLIHLFAIIWLPLKIWKTRSCSVVSGKSQLLYLLVFICRYLDLFTNFVSHYNTFMKIFFIAVTAGTVFLIYKQQLRDLIMTRPFSLICQNLRKLCYRQYDSFRIELLIIPCLVLAIVVNESSQYRSNTMYSIMEIFWAFSEYLEAVTLIPQLVMIIKSGETEAYMATYIIATTLYRGLYILNWIYRYNYENFYDIIAIVSGCFQTVVNTIISCYVLRVYKKQKASYKLGIYLTEEFADGLPGEKQEKKIKEDTEKGITLAMDLAPVHDTAKNLERLLLINESQQARSNILFF